MLQNVTAKTMRQMTTNPWSGAYPFSVPRLSQYAAPMAAAGGTEQQKAIPLCWAGDTLAAATLPAPIAGKAQAHTATLPGKV